MFDVKEDECSSKGKKKKEQKITFTQIEHHTMEITKKRKSLAISSIKIDRLVQFNEREME